MFFGVEGKKMNMDHEYIVVERSIEKGRNGENATMIFRTAVSSGDSS